MLLLLAILVGVVLGFLQEGLFGAFVGGVGGLAIGFVLFAIMGVFVPSGVPPHIARACAESFIEEHRVTAEATFGNRDETQLISATEQTIHAIFKRARALAPSTASLAQSFTRLGIKKAATEMMQESRDPARLLFIDRLEKHIEKEMYPEPQGDPQLREAMDRQLGLGHHPENEDSG
jgi:hypothetical protein